MKIDWDYIIISKINSFRIFRLSEFVVTVQSLKRPRTLPAEVVEIGQTWGILKIPEIPITTVILSLITFSLIPLKSFSIFDFEFFQVILMIISFFLKLYKKYIELTNRLLINQLIS